jgi:hypothetical protein
VDETTDDHDHADDGLVRRVRACQLAVIYDDATAVSASRISREIITDERRAAEVEEP